MKKFKTELRIHEPNDIVALRRKEPPARLERDVLANAERDASHAAERAAQYGREVERLPAAIAEGTATLTDLEKATTSHKAAILVLPNYASRVKAAEIAVEMATQKATREDLATANQVRDDLHRAIQEQIRPILLAYRHAEAALDDFVRSLGQANGVEALEWPQTLAQESAQLQNANMPLMEQLATRAR